MKCKYCGAQIAPGEERCGRRNCLEAEAFDLLTQLTTAQAWALIEKVCAEGAGE